MSCVLRRSKNWELQKNKAISDEKIRLSEKRKNEIRSHKHTIKNFQFQGHLQRLMERLPNNKETEVLYENISNTIMVRDIATDFIFTLGDDEQPDRTLIYRAGYTTYLKILNLIRGTTTAYKDIEYWHINEIDIEQHLCNQIPTQDLMHVFNILINLYSNIQRNSDDKDFFITVDTSKSQSLRIVFKNAKKMKDEYVEYLNTRIRTQGIVQGQGLEHIVTSLNHVPNVKIITKTTKKQTKITLNISIK